MDENKGKKVNDGNFLSHFKSELSKRKQKRKNSVLRQKKNNSVNLSDESGQKLSDDFYHSFNSEKDIDDFYHTDDNEDFYRSEIDNQEENDDDVTNQKEEDNIIINQNEKEDNNNIHNYDQILLTRIREKGLDENKVKVLYKSDVNNNNIMVLGIGLSIASLVGFMGKGTLPIIGLVLAILGLVASVSTIKTKNRLSLISFILSVVMIIVHIIQFTLFK